MVFEIVSDSSVYTDLITRNAEYRATASIQRYVVVQQAHPGATIFTRKGDDWVTEIVSAGGTLRMPEIGVEVSLANLYEGLDLPAEPLPDRRDDGLRSP